MNFFIVTGGSKGLGREIVSVLSEQETNSIVTVSRSDPRFEKPNVTFIEYDLDVVSGISALMGSIFASLKGSSVNCFLINNAGLATPIGLIGSSKDKEIIRSFHVNALSPVLLCSAFIQHTRSITGKHGIVNLSSGAGRNPYHGWSSYCTTKAALQMLTRCLALENPDMIIEAYDPGVIDTEMQSALRQQNKENFSQVDKFRQLQQENKLLTPEMAARKFIGHFFSTLGK
jgi:benzil reductase ((S)-benzoin forming)